jgi:hypothetical protein
VQWWQVYGHHIEAVKQVFPKQTLLYRAFKIPVSRGDDPNIDRDALFATYALNGFLLQNAK